MQFIIMLLIIIGLALADFLTGWIKAEEYEMITGEPYERE